MKKLTIGLLALGLMLTGCGTGNSSSEKNSKGFIKS